MMPLSAPPYIRAVVAIRERFHAGETVAELATDYDLAMPVVDAIVRARTVAAAGDVLRLLWEGNV